MFSKYVFVMASAVFSLSSAFAAEAQCVKNHQDDKSSAQNVYKGHLKNPKADRIVAHEYLQRDLAEATTKYRSCLSSPAVVAERSAAAASAAAEAAKNACIATCNKKTFGKDKCIKACDAPK